MPIDMKSDMMKICQKVCGQVLTVRKGWRRWGRKQTQPEDEDEEYDEEVDFEGDQDDYDSITIKAVGIDSYVKQWALLKSGAIKEDEEITVNCSKTSSFEDESQDFIWWQAMFRDFIPLVKTIANMNGIYAKIALDKDRVVISVMLNFRT
jgi:hypothetical protein